MSTYAQIREQVVEGVIRRSTDPPPLDRIRMLFDAGFFQINSSIAEAFAADNNRRELLRVVETLTFTAGVATLPADVLKKFIEDCTLTTTPVAGSLQAYYGFRKYPDYIRGVDPRLGKWTQIGETLLATTPATIGAGAIVLVGAASFSSIQSPPVPATEGATFVAPDDYISDFIEAMTSFIAGQTANVASEST